MSFADQMCFADQMSLADQMPFADRISFADRIGSPSGPAVAERRPRCWRWLRKIIAVMAFAALIGIGCWPQTAAAAPCDIYASAAVPCVAAHSTTRALLAAYNGPLYQVTRASDHTTLNIALLAPGGFANAAAQDAFCINTTCLITRIYDQTARHNDLTIEAAGGAGAADVGSPANALPVTAGGHQVYGLLISEDNALLLGSVLLFGLIR